MSFCITRHSRLRDVFFPFQIMLNCWQKEPDSRPTFQTLFYDFHDFEAAVESKYYYSPDEFMQKEDLNR